MTNLPEMDQIQGFMFENLPIRGVFVRLHASFQVAISKRTYPPAAQQLLGNALTVVSLLSNTIKSEGALALQAQGEGPVSLLLGECTHDGHVRGLVHYKEPLDAGSLDSLFGNGTMALTLKSADKQHNYQGLVSLQGEDLSEAIEHYFSHSEQLPTRIYLANDGMQACGLLLQTLPTSEMAQSRESWQHITTLADTLSEDELLNLSNREILHRLFHEETIRLFESEPLSFRCSCSLQRMQQVLVSLGKEELLSILEEFGTVDTYCEFCNHHYLFDVVDIHKLLADPNGPSPGERKH
jgi:molecular chaperone Hsp33